MAARKPKPPIEFAGAVLQCWRTHERVHQLLLDALPAAVWNAKPPGGKGRTIAAMVSHVHNVRRMWLVVSAKGHAAPAKLARATVTQAQFGMWDWAKRSRETLE